MSGAWQLWLAGDRCSGMAVCTCKGEKRKGEKLDGDVVCRPLECGHHILFFFFHFFFFLSGVIFRYMIIFSLLSLSLCLLFRLLALWKPSTTEPLSFSLFYHLFLSLSSSFVSVSPLLLFLSLEKKKKRLTLLWWFWLWWLFQLRRRITSSLCRRRRLRRL